MSIDKCLKNYGYKYLNGYYIKEFNDITGMPVINCMFSHANGHYPLRIQVNGKPRLKWGDKRVFITDKNVEMLCKKVESTYKKYIDMEVNYVLQTIK